MTCGVPVSRFPSPDPLPGARGRGNALARSLEVRGSMAWIPRGRRSMRRRETKGHEDGILNPQFRRLSQMGNGNFWARGGAQYTERKTDFFTLTFLQKLRKVTKRGRLMFQYGF